MLRKQTTFRVSNIPEGPKSSCNVGRDGLALDGIAEIERWRDGNDSLRGVPETIFLLLPHWEEWCFSVSAEIEKKQHGKNLFVSRLYSRCVTANNSKLSCVVSSSFYRQIKRNPPVKNFLLEVWKINRKARKISPRAMSFTWSSMKKTFYSNWVKFVKVSENSYALIVDG